MSFEVITLIGPNCSRYKRKGPFRCQMAVSGAYDISYGDKVWEDQGSKSVKTGRGERVYAIEEKEMFLGSSIDSESSNLRQLREVFNSLRWATTVETTVICSLEGLSLQTRRDSGQLQNVSYGRSRVTTVLTTVSCSPPHPPSFPIPSHPIRPSPRWHWAKVAKVRTVEEICGVRKGYFRAELYQGFLVMNVPRVGGLGF